MTVVLFTVVMLWCIIIDMSGMIDNLLVAGRLPNGLAPYKHQKRDADRFLVEQSLLLSYDVGGGKTLTALLAGMGYQNLTGGKVVAVVPASVLENWRRSANGLIDISLHSSGKIPTPNDFGTDQFMLVVDEAHQYQNIDSMRTGKILALCDAAQGVLPMTATPIRNYPSNLFPLLRAVGHRLGLDYTYYMNRYCDGRYNGSSNLMELSRLIANKIIIADKDELTDLPPFKRITKQVKFDAVGSIVFQETFSKLRNEYIERMRNGDVSERGWYIVMINNLRLATSKAKAIYAAKLAKYAVDKGHQVAIFTNFKVSANYIDRWCKEDNSVLLTGEVSKPNRQKLVDQFQDGQSKVFVVTRAGTDGINLQRGTVSIVVDRTWSPFDMIQFEGRTHRNGQNKPCTSIWLQDGIVDPYIDNMMLYKYEVARKALRGTIDTMPGVGRPSDWAQRLAQYIFKER